MFQKLKVNLRSLLAVAAVLFGFQSLAMADCYLHHPRGPNEPDVDCSVLLKAKNYCSTATPTTVVQVVDVLGGTDSFVCSDAADVYADRCQK